MKHFTTKFCTPPAIKRPGESLAAPAAAGQGVCTRHNLRRCFSSSFAFARRYSLTAPITKISTATPMYTKTALVTSTPFIDLFLWFGVMFSACLLAVVIFHWVIVPLFDWIARRFFA